FVVGEIASGSEEPGIDRIPFQQAEGFHKAVPVAGPDRADCHARPVLQHFTHRIVTRMVHDLAGPGQGGRWCVTGRRRSERGADRTNENLVPRSWIEPKAAYRNAAPSHLNERPALHLAVAAVGGGALANESNAE